MPLKTLFIIVLAALAATPAQAADEGSGLLESERIGQLHQGLPESQLKGAIACPPQRGPLQLTEADGIYHQEWKYPGCGIVLDMVAETEGGPTSIGSITVAAPSTLATGKGIKIGSPEAEVRKAYRADWNREESATTDGGFVAGSLFGGLIFGFEGGKVSSIFLGAASE